MRPILMSVLMGHLAFSVDAAIFSYELESQVSWEAAPTMEESFGFDAAMGGYATMPPDFSRNVTATAGPLSSSASVSFDSATGVLRGGAVADGRLGEGSSRSSVFFDVIEMFKAKGSGTFRVVLEWNGLLSANRRLSENDGSAYSQAKTSASVGLDNIGAKVGPVSDSFAVSYEGYAVQKPKLFDDDPLSGLSGFERDDKTVYTKVIVGDGRVVGQTTEVAGREVVEVEASDGDVIRLIFSTQFSSESSRGFGWFAESDFGRTGFLSLETTNGLEMSPADPNFLAMARGRPVGPVTSVPLPAGIGQLIAALFGLRLLSMRSRNQRS